MSSSPFHSICLKLFVAVILSSARARAETDVDLGGHVKNQLTKSNLLRNDVRNAVGPDRPVSAEFDARTNLNLVSQPYSFESAGDFSGLLGDGLEAERLTRAASGRPVPASFNTDRRRLFDLDKELAVDENGFWNARVDRLNGSYSADELVIKAGRQAISWGNGIAFQTLDPFNPFSPTDIDKDYKTGDDMLYSQWLLEDGSDFQLLAVPRRDFETHDIEESESSFALKYQKSVSDWEANYDLLVARHYGEEITGAGINKSLFEAVWRLDAAWTTNDGGGFGSVVTNVDRSWILWNTNMYGFLEYFYSGIGEKSGDYQSIDAALAERIVRGELYTLARNYIAAGLRIEISPLINLYPSQIVNIDDQSGIVQVRAEYYVLQDATVTAGIDIPWGGHGSEFGGVPATETQVLAPSTNIYIRTAFYY